MIYNKEAQLSIKRKEFNLIGLVSALNFYGQKLPVFIQLLKRNSMQMLTFSPV